MGHQPSHQLGRIVNLRSLESAHRPIIESGMPMRHLPVLFMVLSRAVYRNFAKGGPIWGMEKRGGGGTLCMRSTPSRGIRGHAPPGKFWCS